MGFIEEIAPLIQKYAPQYGIKVVSPIIAQAVIESNLGTSNKVRNPDNGVMLHNYFGLKYTSGRCPTGNGYFYEVGSEQNIDGTYKKYTMVWQKFPSMDACVQGYFDFLKNGFGRYDNLKGITDPLEYIKKIKQDGYATSIQYVDTIWNCVQKYGLTKYDPQPTKVFNIVAGHSVKSQGASKYINEVIEDRLVKDAVIRLLKANGHTVFDCTSEASTSSLVLSDCVSRCNKNEGIDVHIHFNAGSSDKDGNTTGTEIYVYNSSSKVKDIAKKVVDNVASLGFKNRGLKTSSSLYVLKNSKNPSMLLEVCFVDDKDDVAIYDKVGVERVAKAIVEGLTGETVNVNPTPFLVQVMVDDLNIRQGAGTSFNVVGQVRKGIKYTIVETVGNWGKLKSGAGWISISDKYVKRI